MLRFVKKRFVTAASFATIMVMVCLGLFYTQRTEIIKPIVYSLQMSFEKGFSARRVDLEGSYTCSSNLTGVLINGEGSVANITASVRTELVFSFSPAAEENFKRTLVDPNHEQTVFANSPAMIWDGEKFVVVMRMWLDKELTLGKTKNIFSDNYFYMRHFDDRMRQLDYGGRVLGIPTRVHEELGDGPIEPRAFLFNNTLHLSFNTGVTYGGKFVDTTFFWNLEKEQIVIPKIVDGQPLLKQHTTKINRDKHWSPFTWRDRLYFIYSPDPLRILSCDINFTCSFFYSEAPDGYRFSDANDCLRGGTPTVLYKDDYFITVFHVTLFRADPGFAWKRYYTFNLAVLKMALKPKIVYLSGPIQINSTLMDSIPMVRHKYINDSFLFPVTLLLEDMDKVIIGGHINDHSSYLFRLSGLRNLMERVMAAEVPLRGLGAGALNTMAKTLSMINSGFKFH